MAITQASLTSGTDGSGGFVSSSTIASTTPTANRLIIAIIHSAAFQPDQIDPPTAVTVASVSMTAVANIKDTVTGQCVSLWRGLSASPGSGTGTITFDETQYYANWSVFELAGIDTSGTNGSGAIVQSASNKDVTGSGTAAAVTLSAFGNAANGAVFGSGWTNTGATIRTCTPDTGWTEVHDTGSTYAGGAAAAAIESQWRASNDTSATGTWSAAGFILSIAAEIKAASAGTAVAPLAMAHSRRRRSA